VISEQEDWVLAGLLIFLAGLIVYGYKFGGFDESTPSNGMSDLIAVTMVKA
jgi:hypothetical protein